MRKRTSQLARMAAAAAILLAGTVTAQADLSAAEISAIDGKSGIRVFSSDGGFVGVTNGVSVRGERTRLFLIARSGSFLRSRGRDVNITTFTDRLTLKEGAIVLDAPRQTIQLRAGGPIFIDDGPIEIALLGRR